MADVCSWTGNRRSNPSILAFGTFFNNINGTNMKHAAIVLKAVFVEKRRIKGPVDYLSWIKAGKFQGFVI